MIRQLVATALRGGPNVPEPCSPSSGVVTDDHKESFVNNGYVVLPSQIDAPKISAAKREIYKSLGKPDRSQTGPGGQYVPPKISACPEITNHKSILAAVKPAIAHAHALLGKGTLPVWAVQIAIRYPGDMCIPGTYQPIPGWRKFCHVDGMEQSWPPNRFVCLVGVALTPCEEMGGSFVVFPGTHRVVGEHLTPAPTTKPDKLPSPTVPALQVTMQPGDVVISHYLLQHSFAPHTRDEPRIILYVRLHYPDYDTTSFSVWQEWPGLWDTVAAVAAQKNDIGMLVWLLDATDDQQVRYADLRRCCLAKLTGGDG